MKALSITASIRTKRFPAFIIFALYMLALFVTVALLNLSTSSLELIAAGVCLTGVVGAVIIKLADKLQGIEEQQITIDDDRLTLGTLGFLNFGRPWFAKLYTGAIGNYLALRQNKLKVVIKIPKDALSFKELTHLSAHQVSSRIERMVNVEFAKKNAEPFLKELLKKINSRTQ